MASNRWPLKGGAPWPCQPLATAVDQALPSHALLEAVGLPEVDRRPIPGGAQPARCAWPSYPHSPGGPVGFHQPAVPEAGAVC